MRSFIIKYRAKIDKIDKKYFFSTLGPKKSQRIAGGN